MEARTSRVIDRPADAVWADVADFPAIASWHPALARSAPAAGPHLREILTRDGQRIVEELLTDDDRNRVQEYALVRHPFPVTDYRARIEVRPLDPGRCEVHWSARFHPLAGDGRAERAMFENDIFGPGLDGLANGRSAAVEHPPEQATLGVEEEFVLLDTGTHRPVPRAGPVIAGGRLVLGAEHLVPEISQAMVETVSPVCAGAADLARELTRLRTGTASEARRHGCLLLASGVAPSGSAGPGHGDDPDGLPALHDHPRYNAIRRRFGPLIRHQGTCACHVHVGVPDLATAVAVVNHLRPWLPLLLALTANSPYWQGADTGYASWRTVLWGRWPTAGPPPFLHSPEHYEDLVGALVASGAALDPAMIYWYARPSRHVPTVEIRIADVLPTTGQTVAYALLVRALVARARAALAAGHPAPQVEQDVLAAACWQAAREGVTGSVLDLLTAPAPGPRSGFPVVAVPVVEQIGTALRLAGPHLTADDRRTVEHWLAELVRTGGASGAQRAAHHGAGRMGDLIESLAVAPDLTADRPPLRTRPRSSVEETT
ncbi:glutamate--cysteine ligase [Kitasatospora sp. NPDC088783]|uniref:glutamate--cysteine ligase n=1 Tax=Kitasatospora sp. NPDC088783 TaxID=3364077 RepID=UPI00382CF2B6